MHRIAATASFAAAAAAATAAAGASSGGGGRWHVYVVETMSGKLYTGISTDVTRRLRQHAGHIKGGAKALRGDPPKRLRYAETAENRSAATRREIALKRLPRAEKMRLVAEAERLTKKRASGGLLEGMGGLGESGDGGVVALTTGELAALDPFRISDDDDDAAADTSAAAAAVFTAHTPG